MKLLRQHHPSRQADKTGAQNDDRKRDLEKKMAMKAAAAMATMTSFFSAFLPMRMTAAATMAVTAGLSPSKMEAIQGTLP